MLATQESHFLDCRFESNYEENTEEVNHGSNEEIEAEDVIIKETTMLTIGSDLKVENEGVVPIIECDLKFEEILKTEDEPEEDFIEVTGYVPYLMCPVVLLKKLPSDLTRSTNTFKCLECGLIFHSEESLDCHTLLVHKNLDPSPVVLIKDLPSDIDTSTNTFKCFECSLILHDEKSLDTHVLLVHKIFDLLHCSECEKQFDNKVTLSKHILSTHCKSGSIHKSHFKSVPLHRSPCKSVPLHTCNECRIVFHNIQNLNEHSSICHLRDSGTNFRTKNLPSQKFKQTSQLKKIKIYLCPECDCTFNEKTRQLQHFKTLHNKDMVSNKGENDYSLQLEDSSTRSSATVESRQSKLRLFKCPECLFVFNQRVELFTHLLSDHKSTSEFKCSECNYSVNDQIYLDIHTRTVHNVKKNYGNDSHLLGIGMSATAHREQINYNCSVCNVCFNKKDCFERHLSTHKKYVQNSENNGNWSESSSLKMRIHLSHKKFKLFKCSNCDFAFNQIHQLRRHVDVFHNNINS